MPMVIEGYKGIAAELERIWGRSVSEDAAFRYAHSDSDPLPVEEARRRVWISLEQLEAWAARARRRVQAEASPDQLALPLPAR